MTQTSEFRISPTTIVLIIGVILSTIMLWRTRPDDPEEAKTPGLGLAYFLIEAELVGMGEDGRVLYRVNAARAAQSLDDSAIGMEDVHLIYAPSAEVPWDLVADTGRIPPDGKIIELQGRVLAVSRPGDDPGTTIRTDYLELEPGTRMAKTNRKVIVEYDGRRVNATGLQANLETSQLKLLSNVNGRFLP